MTPLIAWGVVAMVATVAFTAVMAFGAGATAGTGQTRRSALIEAWMNVVIGFSINFVANYAIFPLIGVHITAEQNFWMGCIFTAVSVFRQFVIRRWFNDKMHRVAQRLSGSANA